MTSRGRSARNAAWFAVALASVIPPPAAHARPARTIVGQIMDSTCLAKGEQPGADHAECARRCIQGGAPIAIVEDRTKQVYIALGPEGVVLREKLLPHVGRRCKLTGDVVRRGGSQFLIVREVTPEHEHHAEEGGIVAMAGDIHLEAVASKSGEVRVFLSDAFRKPLGAAGRSGRVELGGTAQTAPVSAPLLPEPGGRYLAAKFDPFRQAHVEATVRIPIPADPGYFITFMLDPQDAPVSPAPGARAGVAAPPAAAREITITVEGGYQPHEIVLRKGEPARLRFRRKDSGQCAGEVVIPALGVKKALAPLAETVVEVTPKQAGEFEMTCGMKMMRARIIVKE